MRMSVSRFFLPGVLLFFLLSLLLTACQFGGRDPHEVVYWTTDTGTIGIKAEREIVNGFNKANPDLHVKLVIMPGGTANITPLLTAVRGGTGPDVFFLDRFVVSQYAAIGLLENLQPLIAKHDPNLSKQFLQYAWNEASFRGSPYALPLETDLRALYYNKDVLRQAGIDPNILDPSHGPITLDTLSKIAFKVNHLDAQGSFDRLGFVPWTGAGYHTTWAMDYGAKFFDPATCQLVMNDPAMLAAYQFQYDWAAKLTKERVDTFFSTYQPDNAPPSQNPFFTGQLAMTVDGDYFLASLDEYAPKLNYGITYIPVAHQGQAPFNWAGGHSLVIPKGAQNEEGAYRFMRYMTGPEGQRIYTRETTHLPTWNSLLSEDSLFSTNHKFFLKMLPYTKSRVPLPVWSKLRTEMDTAQDKVVLHAATPQEALQTVYKHVQPQLQQYCPL